MEETKQITSFENSTLVDTSTLIAESDFQQREIELIQALSKNVAKELI